MNRFSRATSGTLAALLAVFGAGNGVANAVIQNEITAEWSISDSTVPNSTAFAVDVHYNANDTDGAKVTIDPNVLTATLKHFAAGPALPADCLTTGVSPASAITYDKATQTSTVVCNLGPLQSGTAVTLSIGGSAIGSDGDEVSGTIVSGSESVTLPPKTITATRSADLVTTFSRLMSSPMTTITTPFGISVVPGAEIPTQVEFDLTTTVNLGDQNADTTLGGAVLSCVPQNLGSNIIPQTDPVRSPNPTCAVTNLGGGKWHVVMTDLKVTSADAVTTASDGTPIPAGTTFLNAGGFRWTFANPAAVSVSTGLDIVASNVTFTSPGGTTYAESNTANDTQTLTINPVGSFASSWVRNASIAGYPVVGSDVTSKGVQWDARTYIPMATDGADAVAFTAQYNPTAQGICTMWQTPGEFTGINMIHTRGATATVEYLVGTVPGNDLANYNCNSGTWVSTPPANLSTVHAIRATYNPANFNSSAADYNAPVILAANVHFPASMVTNDGIWEAGTYKNSAGSWFTPTTTNVSTVNTTVITDANTPDYASTTGARDVLYVSGALPHVVKASDKDSANVGESIKYTLTAGLTSPNSGTSPMTLTDTIPNGLTYNADAVPAPTSVTPNANGTTTVVWTVDATWNKDFTVTYSATTKIPGSYKNTVQAVNSDPALQPGFNGTVASASDTNAWVKVGQTNLVKDVLGSEFAIEGTNTWTLALTNSDSVAQECTDVIDVLPYNGDARTTAFAGSYTIGDINAGTGTVYYTSADPATLSYKPSDSTNGGFCAPGGSAGWTTTKPSTVTGIRIIDSNLGVAETFTYTIDFATTGNNVGDVYDNIAAAEATTTELKMVQAEQTTTVAEPSKLQLDKKLVTDPATITADTVLEYVVTVLNSGTADAPNVVMSDLGGMGIDASTITLSNPSQGTVSGAAWNVGTLKVNSPQTVTVKANITAGFDLTQDIINDASVTSPSHPYGGSQIPNADVTSDTDQFDREVVKTLAHTLKVDKALDPASQVASPGSTVTYVVTAKNVGPGLASEVVVTDVPAANLDAASVVLSAPSKGTVAGKVWTVGELASGESQTVKVTAKVAATYDGKATVVNNVVIGDSVYPAPDGTNAAGSLVTNEGVDADTDQFDAVVINPAPTTIKVVKTLAADQMAYSGSTVKYTVEVKNAGPNVAYDVAVQDQPGANLDPASVVLSNPSKGSVSGKDWAVGDLAVGESATAEVTAKVIADYDGKSDVVNGVGAKDSNTTTPTTGEPNKTVDEDTDRWDNEVLPATPVPTLKLVKTADAGQDIAAGKKVVFTVTVKNAGTVPAIGVKMTDLPKDNLVAGSIEMSNPSKGTVDNASRVWTVGDMAPGEVQKVTVTGTIVSDYDGKATVVNAAGVADVTTKSPTNGSSNTTVDADTDRWDDEALTPALVPVIKLDKSATDASKVYAGSTITYKLTVKNTVAASSGVVVTELPGANLDAASVTLSSPSKGTVNGKVWTIGDMGVDEVQTVVVTAKVAASYDGKTNVVNGAGVKNSLTTSPTTGATNPTVDDDTDRFDSVSVPSRGSAGGGGISSGGDDSSRGGLATGIAIIALVGAAAYMFISRRRKGDDESGVDAEENSTD